MPTSHPAHPRTPQASTPPSLADQIEDLLPQTQCTKCGYPACRPYAEAIASGEADINQCPPGGIEGVARLAHLLGRKVIPINPVNGHERPRPVAVIDEALCIGCTLCIQACPVDAIIGAAKQMHTILADVCTGCDLCVAPCPVDCIAMVPASGDATGWAAWSRPQADLARDRYEFHSYLRKRDEGENDKRLEEKALMKLADLSHHSQHTDPFVLDKKRAVIEAALARARAKRDAEANPNKPV